MENCLILNDKKLTIEKYGVKLVRFNRDILELVRSWRNSPEILIYMRNTKPISYDEQISWFNKVENDNSNLYFLTYYKDIPFAVNSISKIDLITKNAYNGGYLGKLEYGRTGLLFNAAYALADFSFNILELLSWDIDVLKNNLGGIKFNLMLGAKIIDEDDKFVKFKYYKSDFLLKQREFENKYNKKRG